MEDTKLYDGCIKNFKDEKDFVDFIVNKTSFDGKVFLSYGPEAKDIIEFD